MVQGATRPSDGQIVVADRGSNQLKYFDSSGRFLLGAGGSGEGPGEFSSLYAVWPWAGDSVAAYDFGRRFLAVFNAEGRFIRAVSTDLTHGFAQPVGVLETGELIALLVPAVQPGPVGSISRDTVEYVRFHPTGEFSNTIARVPGFERYSRGFRGRVSTGRRPLGHWLFGTIGREHFYYGPGDRYELTVYGADGRLRRLIRRAERDRLLSDEEVETHKREQMAEAPEDPEVRREWQRLVDEAPYPDSLPAYQRLLVDREENFWVQEYERPGAESVEWSVFDPNGRWLCDVTMPTDLRVFEIGNDYVLALWRDDLDIEYVRVYGLIKPSAPS
ncbi:6-bladed beta-propeller [Gemmatimonadota bacterium]